MMDSRMPATPSASDSPISTLAEDRLGRSQFSTRLAQKLLEGMQEDSIVIGLFGPWGSGKSSIINMTLSVLQDEIEESGKPEAAPIVVRFNPWHFSDQERLMSLFLDQLLRSIMGKAAKGLEGLKDFIGKYGRYLSVLGPIPVAGDLAKGLADLTQLASQQESLEQLRKELDEAFRQFGRRVIILVDDVDRLTQTQIRQLFQTIKLNANFPNTVYVIAADRSVVEKSLNTEQGVSGRAYLEKIVQTAFDVPMPDPSRISRILNSGLDEVIASIRETDWDDYRWASLYDGGFRDLFINLRDVKRFIGTLSFTLPMVQGEVNPVDFVGLEAVRVFAPDVYDEIAKGKPVFVGPQEHQSDPELARAVRDAVIQEIERIMTKAGTRRAGIEGICRQLFPMIELRRTTQPPGAAWMEPRRIARRISAPDMFDRYFLLGIPNGDISQAELTTICELAVTPDQLIEHLKRYSQDGRLWRLTELLPRVIADLDDAAIPTFCEALLGTIESYPDQRLNPNSWGTTSRLTSLIARALMRLSEEDRCGWFRHRITTKCTPYATLIQLTREERGLERKPLDSVFTEECFGELKIALVEEVRVALASGYKMKNLPGALAVWKRWSDKPTEVDDYISQRLATPGNALTFVADCLDEIRIRQQVDDTLQKDWLLDLKTLGGLIDLEQLWRKIESVRHDMPQLTEQEARAIEVFVAEYNVAG